MINKSFDLHAYLWIDAIIFWSTTVTITDQLEHRSIISVISDISMTVPIAKKWSICLQIIIDKKGYRSLFTEASKVYIKYLLDKIRINSSVYAYKFCENKLNRILKPDEDI
jgi:hypothetical protein